MAAELDDIDDLGDLGDLGDLDIGVAEGEAGAEGAAPATASKVSLLSGRRKFIVIGVVAVLLLGTGGYFIFGSHHDAREGAKSAKGSAAAEGGDKDKPATMSYYFTLDPAFVVNFIGRGQAKYLQVNIEGVTREPSIKEDISLHLPHIRNNIVMLLSSKTYDELITAEGKEKLRKDVLSEVRKILKDETGKEGDTVDNIYFTSFVMQ